jgi:hypothetical protein
MYQKSVLYGDAEGFQPELKDVCFAQESSVLVKSNFGKIQMWNHEATVFPRMLNKICRLLDSLGAPYKTASEYYP